jgi:hypothetical protein
MLIVAPAPKVPVRRDPAGRLVGSHECYEAEFSLVHRDRRGAVLPCPVTELAVVVASPAKCLPVCSQRTGVLHARHDLDEGYGVVDLMAGLSQPAFLPSVPKASAMGVPHADQDPISDAQSAHLPPTLGNLMQAIRLPTHLPLRVAMLERTPSTPAIQVV